MRTPKRNAVPRFRQSSANILVAVKASSMLAPEAITAHTIAPAEEPANGVVSCISITKLSPIIHTIIHRSSIA